MRPSPASAHARPIAGRSDPFARPSACPPCRPGPRHPDVLAAELSGGPISAESFSRPFPFLYDVHRLLVGPKSQIHRLAQFPFARPLRELHLRDEGGPDP